MFGLGTDGTLRGRLRRPQADSITILDHVTVIDGTGAAPVPDAAVVLRGDRIADVLSGAARSRLPVEPAAEPLDLSGRFLTPGLIDCHVHLYGSVGHDAFRRSIEPYPSVRILRAARDAHRVLAAGFTTVRHLGHGDPRHTQGVKDAIGKGLIAGPRMLTSGWAISQTGGHGNNRAWPYHLVEELRPRSAFCDGPDACRKFVRRVLGDGADCIKIYTTEGVIGSPDRQLDIPNFTLAEIEAMTDEAHRRGARVAAHATGLAGALNAVRGGVDTLEHGPSALDAELVELLRERGTSLVPTLSVFEWASTDGPADGLPLWAAERAASWLPGRREMARAAAAAGVTVAVGTDSGAAPRGGRNAAELVALVSAGLTPLEAIRAATQSSARALGIADDVGTIEAGKRADLLVLRSDPSRDVGVFCDPAALELIIQSQPGPAATAA